MLVAKYKRAGSSDEDDHTDDSKSTNQAVDASSSAPTAQQSEAPKASTSLVRKTVSVAPAIPEYKMGVRHLRFSSYMAKESDRDLKSGLQVFCKRSNLPSPLSTIILIYLDHSLFIR